MKAHHTTYNDAALHCVTESHRFVPSIASSLAALSYRRVGPFTGLRPPLSESPRNAIFLFEEPSIGRVLPAFAELALKLPKEHRSVIKAVGGIGKTAGANGLTLPSYWTDFDSRARSLTSRPKSLCQAVRFCTHSNDGDLSGRYKYLQSAILEWMRQAGRQHTTRSGKTMSFNPTVLRSYLKESDKALAFGEIMNLLLSNPFPSEELWLKIIESLGLLLEIGELNEDAAKFAAYERSGNGEFGNDEAPVSSNVFDEVDGVSIALATIHSVKGETHDATLVCETKYRSWYDLQEMAGFLCNPDATRPEADYAKPMSKETNRAAFMKRLFVAMSRPRYLLCLAMKKSHLTEAQLAYLQDTANWEIQDLTATVGSTDS